VIRDGIFYGLGFGAAGAAVARLLGWPWAIPFWVLAAFTVYFFRNPDRLVPADPALVVSPADGKVTAVEVLPASGPFQTRISIFLSVFDVHVNRSPVAGRVTAVTYHSGRFLNALNPASAVENERNEVRVEGPQGMVVFVQIAGLIARRIVFWPKLGAVLERGERVGLIKFGSRVDVYLGSTAELLVRVGDRVKGGGSSLARLPVAVDAGVNRSAGSTVTRSRNHG